MRSCSLCDAKSKGVASGPPYPICGHRSHPATPAPPFCRPPRVGHLGGGDEDPARRSSRSKCRRAEAGGPEFWPARDGHLPSRWPARRQADGCASRGRLEHRFQGRAVRKGGREELWHASPEQKFVRYTLSRRAINVSCNSCFNKPKVVTSPLRFFSRVHAICSSSTERR